MKQSFFLWGECLGSREVEQTWEADPQGNARGTRFSYTNTAFFCPHCAEIWGRIWHEKARPEWLVDSRYCPKHQCEGMLNAGWTDYKQGSFLCPFPDHVDAFGFSADLPTSLIIHEFNMLMAKCGRDTK